MVLMLNRVCCFSFASEDFSSFMDITLQSQLTNVDEIKSILKEVLVSFKLADD